MTRSTEAHRSAGPAAGTEICRRNKRKSRDHHGMVPCRWPRLLATAAAEISRQHLHRWNRNDELSAPRANLLHLFHHFFLDVPGKDQQEIGLGFGDLLRSVDGDVRAGKKSSLFVVVFVDDVIDEVGAHSAIVEKS